MSAEIVVTPSTRKSHGFTSRPEHLDERQHEPAHAGVDVAVRADRRRQRGDRRDVVLHALRVLRGRPDDQHGVLVAQRGHRLDVGGPVVLDRRLVEFQPEVVRRLVERSVRRLGDHHLGFGDPPLGGRSLAGCEHAAQDRLGAAAGEEPGDGVVAVQQTGGPTDHLGLDLPERRERLGVERVLVEVQASRLLGDLVHRRTAVVDHSERASVGPLDVVDPLGGEVTDDVVDGAALLVERSHGEQCRALRVGDLRRVNRPRLDGVVEPRRVPPGARPSNGPRSRRAQQYRRGTRLARPATPA